MFAGIFAITVIAVQVYLIVHVFRNSNPIYWAFIIFFFPMIGSLAYFFMEVLPELKGNPRARRAVRGLKKTLNPEAEVRQLEKLHQREGSIDSARHLANELLASGRFGDAVERYKSALTGMYENDPDLLVGLAEAQFGAQAYTENTATLERLAAENPTFKSAHGHLLYARALEKSDRTADALQEYDAVSAYFAGAEAGCRYATLLESEQRHEEALSLYRDIVDSADVAPRHYQKAQKTWIARARDGVKRLSA